MLSFGSNRVNLCSPLDVKGLIRALLWTEKGSFVLSFDGHRVNSCFPLEVKGLIRALLWK